jgi:hypothetical protein
LQRFLQWQNDERPEAKLDMLERVLRTYCFSLEEVVPLFAALLSVPLPERYPPLHLTPQRQWQKTHEALKALPPAVVEQVVAKTDGVPLFVEELVKMILESDLVREERDCYVLTGPLPP